MPTNFFSRYPTVNYDLYGDGSLMTLTNITQEVMVSSSKLPDDASVYTYYTIRDGDRPDTVSYNLYGDVQYYWTFFILNAFLKNGLNAAWPLSYYDFNKMMETEYSAYSVITFNALSTTDINGYAVTDFSITELDSKYLPYLRLVNASSYTAKILKYDSVRQQLVIYDISNVSRDTFISSPYYKLAWDDSVNLDGDINNQANIDLKNEWLTFMTDKFIQYNPIEYDKIIEYSNPAITEDELLQVVHAAVLNNSYMPVSVKSPSGVITYPYNWAIYYNAAHTYYDAYGNISTIYNMLYPTLTIEPVYKRFYDIENDENEAKTNIKIIRREKINDFSNAYFAVLTS